METFKHHRKIKIMHSKALINKAPPTWKKNDWWRFYQTFRQVELTPYQFAGLVWQGYSFTPCYTNGRRLEENFSEGWHMAFDFDAHGAALDNLMRPGTFADYFSSFAYATPSSTPEHPKSRVVFIFDDPITDPEKYRQLYQAIARKFDCDGSYTDPACKDPLRLYYGSKGAEMRGNWSVLPSSNFDFVINEYEAHHPPPAVQTVLSVPTRRIHDDARARKILMALADNIATAPDGARHHARLLNARTAGGYIAGDVMDEGEVVDVLTRAARLNTDSADGAIKTIMDGINYGKARPLYIEETDNAAPINGRPAYLDKPVTEII